MTRSGTAEIANGSCCFRALRVSTRQTVSAAANLLFRAGAEALLVLDENSLRVVGVFTPRDVVTVVALGLDPRQLTLDEFFRTAKERVGKEQTSECWLG